MPLPTMSLRAPQEHHQLIRDIAMALRTRPEMASVLRDVLRTQHGDADDAPRITDRNTDVLQAILGRLDAIEERVDALEEREPRMVRIEALEARMDAQDARMDALEQRMDGTGGTAAAPQASGATSPPLVTGGQGTRRRLTAHGKAEVERMIRAGVGDAEIAGMVGMDRSAIRQRRLKLSA